jgi:hypothetical protein
MIVEVETICSSVNVMSETTSWILITLLKIKRYSSAILHLGTRLGSVVSFTPLPFYPGETIPGTHCIGGCVGSRTGLDITETRKISCFCRDTNPDHPAHSPVATSNCAVPADTQLSILLLNMPIIAQGLAEVRN